ncbi:flagellar biosynthesis protein FlhF [Paenibacillus sp. CN-4]|uniref:flagellar biosynthesis protein FlhF n=1 Tax=Paenibacillus nanchangensis TaxID=3348343 RepID=UPI00397CEC8B
MRVKRYVVDTMPDAMQSIRSELGGDAVILSTKEIKVGGFMGMFRKKKIEVVAAVEKEEKAQGRKQQPAPPAPAPVPRSAVPNAYRQAASASKPSARNGEGGNSAYADFASALTEAAAMQDGRFSLAKEPETAPEAPVPAFSIPERGATGNEKPREAAAVQPAAFVSAETGSGPAGGDSELLSEVRQMKQWMERIAKQSVQPQFLPEALEQLRTRLIDQETDAVLIEEWIGSVYDEWEQEGRSWPEERFEAALRARIAGFVSPRIGAGIAPETRVLFVAGPTGVGKTTTIAKLAAEQLFKQGRKVGLVTSDTYRIAAVDQLRTYASILGVPLEVVQSPGDLQRAMSKLEDCDLVLMDTAGRNYRNELLVSELQSLLPGSRSRTETYLVLSLTSKSKDMKKITEHFSKYDLDKVVFTKLDETGTYGPLFNLLNDYPLGLSYMTDGQNVPDDLLMADERRLCELLLGTGVN